MKTQDKFSLRRVIPLSIHYLNSAKRSPIRLIEIVIWPSLELVLFVFLSFSIQQMQQGPTRTGLAIVTGILFWNFFTRIIQEVVGQFLDDILSKNVHNILITPVSTVEIYISLLSTALIKLVIAIAMLLITLSFFFPQLITAIGMKGFTWTIPIVLFASAVGLVILATIFVFGNRIASIAWFVSAIIQPFSCTIYEREVLPAGIKEISYLVPSSYIFEMLREFLNTGSADIGKLYTAYLISIVYMAISFVIFRRLYQYARVKGTLRNL